MSGEAPLLLIYGVIHVVVTLTQSPFNFVLLIHQKRYALLNHRESLACEVVCISCETNRFRQPESTLPIYITMLAHMQTFDNYVVHAQKLKPFGVRYETSVFWLKRFFLAYN